MDTLTAAGQAVTRPGAELQKTNARLTSLDALRGFDMLCILGIDRLLRELGKVSHLDLLKVLADQMNHVPWAGLHFYDVIFPLFIFILGVSLAFSLNRSMGLQHKIFLYL
ncbi:MAG TPA: hypothetical protein VMW54_09635 [Terriglobia bacterium]|nr:hypothetical protein [Terriglobia bacterium]